MKLLLGIVLSAAACFGANATFTIDQVMSAPFASTLLAAPTGSRVAWLLNELGQRNIWVAAAPDWKGHRVTSFNQDDGQDIADFAWAPDGSYLLFARGGDFENGGENPNPDWSPAKPEQAVWSVALDGTPAKRLTEGQAPAISPKGDLIAFIRNGQIFTMTPTGENVKPAVVERSTAKAENLQWSPDGSRLAFVSARGNHSFIGLYTPADHNLRYLDASVDRDSDPVWSPDNTQIAYLRIPTTSRAFAFHVHREGPPWSIRVADTKTGAAREVFRAHPGPGSLFHGVVADHQVFWASGDRLVFPWERTGWSHLYSESLQGGNPVELTPGEGEVEHAALSRDGRTMYFSANFKDIDRRHLWTVDVAGGQPPKQITSGEGIEWGPAPVSSALAFLGSTYNEASHAVVRTAGGQLQRLAPQAAPADFPARSLVKPQPVMITAADGLQIHGQLFLPPGDSNGERHPALIFFHGGSRRQMLLGFHYMYYYSNAYSLNQYLASQGYVVLSVNYRSGIGYGLNFREALHYGPDGASEFNDVIGSGLYLKSRPDVDPKRIGVWGGSYGGYLTALALSRASDLFAAGVDFHGVHDWSTERGIYSAPMGGNPAERNEQQEAARIAFESSPMASVGSWRSPVLLIHGDDDRNVAFSQTVMLVEALRKQPVDFEELIFPNEIHDFLMHRHWVDAYKATADFFARKLRGSVTKEPRP